MKKEDMILKLNMVNDVDKLNIYERYNVFMNIKT